MFEQLPEVGLVFSNGIVVDENLNPYNYSLWQSINFNKNEQDKLMKGFPLEILIKHNAFKSAFKDVILPISEIWVHDGWIAILIAAISKIFIIDKPLIKYRQHACQQIGASKKTFIKRLEHSKKQKIPLSLNLQQYQTAFERVYKFAG